MKSHRTPFPKNTSALYTHHPIIRDDKTTTNIRTVFDTSARDNGPSLYRESLLYYKSLLTKMTATILDFSGSTLYFQINPK